MCMYMYVYVCICMYMYVDVCICMCMYMYVYVCGHPATTRTSLKNTVNIDTNAFFSESNFGAVSTDGKHKCKTQKIQKSKNPKIQKSKKSKNPKI